MASVLIDCAPQPGMLGDSKYHQALWLQRLVNLSKGTFIFLDVFKDIKSTNHIKFINKRNMTCIHLHEIYIWQSLCGEREAGSKNLTAKYFRPRKTICDPIQDETSSTSDFKK